MAWRRVSPVGILPVGTLVEFDMSLSSLLDVSVVVFLVSRDYSPGGHAEIDNFPQESDDFGQITKTWRDGGDGAGDPCGDFGGGHS